MTKSVINNEHDSDSTFQKMLENYILSKINEIHHTNLVPEEEFIETDGFKIDGYSRIENNIHSIAEIYTSLGKLSTGGRKKILADMLKLITYEKTRNLTHIRKLIILTSEEAVNALNSENTFNSWVKQSIKEFNIEILHCPLTPELKEKLKVVRKRQAEGIKKKKK